MNKMNLFEKKIATKEEIENFIVELKKLDDSFNRSVENDNEKKRTHLIAYKGNTNNGTLISVWNTNNKKRVCYSVRISENKQKEIANNEALKILFSNFKYADSHENRCDFYSLEDVLLFFNSLYNYSKSATKETKESETISA